MNIKGTTVEIEKLLINDCMVLCILKTSHSNYLYFCDYSAIIFVTFWKVAYLQPFLHIVSICAWNNKQVSAFLLPLTRNWSMLSFFCLCATFWNMSVHMNHTLYHLNWFFILSYHPFFLSDTDKYSSSRMWMCLTHSRSIKWFVYINSALPM